VVGVEGLDEEQLQLGSSEKFWTLIEARRRQKTVGRTELERRIKDANGSMGATAETHETRVRQPTPNKRAAVRSVRLKPQPKAVRDRRRRST
jgi:hypothetical protein